MNDQIEPLVLQPLTAAKLDTWPIAQLIQYCDLASAGVKPTDLWTLPKHDIKRIHGIS
jgi:hypothetical protein